MGILTRAAMSASARTAATPERVFRVECCQCRGVLDAEHGAPERPQPITTGRPAGWTLCPSCQVTYRVVDDGSRVIYHHCTHPQQRCESRAGTQRVPPTDILCARCQDSDIHVECQTCNFRFCFSCSANCWDCRGHFCLECRPSHACTAPRRPRPWELVTSSVSDDDLSQSAHFDECPFRSFSGVYVGV